MQSVNTRGYLNEEYRLFHSTDQRDLDFEAHNHDFHKVVLCLAGRVTYVMEGTTYYLRPWDILLIPEHQIHQSSFSSEEVYERIILWINDRFLRRFGEPALTEVFQWPHTRHSGLFRPDAQRRGALLEKLEGVEKNEYADTPGHTLLADTYLVQFLLELHGQLGAAQEVSGGSVRRDPKFDQVLEFINGNLSQALTVERLAREFFLSPSYLMHAFKRHTGCTLHQYILQKRLIQAAGRIRAGDPVVASALAAGFSDYTTFLKAFRRQYGCAPGKLRG